MPNPIQPIHTLIGTNYDPRSPYVMVNGDEICCIGFNNETSICEAVVKIFPPNIYGDLCTPGTTARVGFWILPAQNVAATFIGESSIKVFDFPLPPWPNAIPVPRHYSLHKLITPDLISNIQECKNDFQLWNLHCVFVLSEIPLLANNINGNGLQAGAFSTMQAVIQFPRKSMWGFWGTLERRVWESQVFPVHAAILKNKKILLFQGSSAADYNDTFEAETWLEGRGEADFGYDETDEFAQYLQDMKRHYVSPDFARGVGGSNKDKYCGIFDPFTETVTKVKPPYTSADSLYDFFCSAQSVMADGKVYVVGGGEHWGSPDDLETGGAFHTHLGGEHFPGIKTAASYDPDTDTWDILQDTLNGRWYPSTLVMGDGSIFIMGGHPQNTYSILTHSNIDMEIYLPSENRYKYFLNDKKNRPNNEIFSDSSDLIDQFNKFNLIPNSNTEYNNADSTITPGGFPRIFLMPNGNIFCATPVGKNNEIWNTNTKRWSIVPGLNNLPTNVFARDWRSAIVVLLPIRVSMTGKNTYNDEDVEILSMTWDPVAYDQTKENNTFTWRCKPLSASPHWNHTALKPLTESRRNGQGILLPDATVLFAGGTHHPPNPVSNDVVGTLVIEIYNPEKDSWSIGSTMKKSRDYHSIGLLLYDGRVLLGGAVANDGIDSFNRELSMEIYSPDYLWRGPRPVFSINKIELKYGETIELALAENWSADQIGICCIIRLYAVTHSTAFDQRYVELPKRSSSVNKQSISLVIPENSNIAPPGYYYLFILNSQGCPSIAEIIHIST